MISFNPKKIQKRSLRVYIYLFIYYSIYFIYLLFGLTPNEKLASAGHKHCFIQKSFGFGFGLIQNESTMINKNTNFIFRKEIFNSLFILKEKYNYRYIMYPNIFL